MTVLTESDKKVLHDIDQFGYHVVKIMEDKDGPGFCFSIGLHKTFNHPEILIIGLKLDLAHILINNLGESIRKGKRYDTHSPYDNILDGYSCYMVEVDEKYYKEYLGYAMWYYNGPFKVLQCIYPTVNGIYPWQNEWQTELKNVQPILGTIEK